MGEGPPNSFEFRTSHWRLLLLTIKTVDISRRAGPNLLAPLHLDAIVEEEILLLRFRPC